MSHELKKIVRKRRPFKTLNGPRAKRETPFCKLELSQK